MRLEPWEEALLDWEEYAAYLRARIERKWALSIHKNETSVAHIGNIAGLDTFEDVGNDDARRIL